MMQHMIHWPSYASDGKLVSIKPRISGMYLDQTIFFANCAATPPLHEMVFLALLHTRKKSTSAPNWCIVSPHALVQIWVFWPQLFELAIQISGKFAPITLTLQIVWIELVNSTAWVGWLSSDWLWIGFQSYFFDRRREEISGGLVGSIGTCLSAKWTVTHSLIKVVENKWKE